MVGRQVHPTLAVLRERRDRGDRADGYKVGLAVQGGGMRGIVSGAMLTALEDEGFGECFDAVYGASSGAVNAAYFLSGGSWRQLAAYYDDLVDPRFISLRRRIGGGQLMDLDYVLDTVLERTKPLDYAKVLAGDTALHVAVTRVDTMRTEVVHDLADKAELRSALRATSWLPFAVRGVTYFRRHPVLDGAMLTIHPYRLAVADGCTHVLSLSTRRLGASSGTRSVSELALTASLNRIRPGLGVRRRRAGQEYEADRVRLAAGTAEPVSPPYVLDVAPLAWMPAVLPMARDQGRLIVAARHSYALMFHAVRGLPAPVEGAGGSRIVPRFAPIGEEDSDGTGIALGEPHDAAGRAG